MLRELVTVARDGDSWLARLTHPLYGEVVRARTGELRARRLRGRLAVALAEGAPHKVLQRAVLAVDSELEPDPKLLFLAAEQAIHRTDLALAIRLLRHACAAGAGFDAHLALAFTLGFVYQPGAAEQDFLAATALAESDMQRLRVAQSWASNLLFMQGSVARAEAVIHNAESRAEVASGLLGLHALIDFLGDRQEAAERKARAALAGDAPPCAETLAAWALSGVLSLTGRADDVPATVQRAAEASARTLETATLHPNIAFMEVFGLALAGRVTPIRACIERLAYVEAGRFAALAIPIFEGTLALTMGQAGQAARRLVEFRPYYPGHGGGWTAWLESMLCLACGMAGDAEGAREAASRAAAARHPAVTFVQPQIELAHAWAAAAEGAVTAGTRSARAAAALAAASGQHAVEVLARHAAVSFGDREQAGRLRELADLVDGPRARLAAEHAAALAAGDPDRLLVVSARFEAAELLLGAAESAAHAAELLRQRPADAARALAAADRAMTIARSCGARTPALIAIDQPSPLSARQREIATLARRLSNTEIADLLGVSVRTVEGHIYHACVRLCLANRAALAAHIGGGDAAAPRSRGGEAGITR